MAYEGPSVFGIDVLPANSVFEYVAGLVGIDHAAFDPDTMFADHMGLHHFLAGLLSTAQSHGGEEFVEVEYVEGVENPADVFPNVTCWLVKHGYCREEIAKALGHNVLRVPKETWAG